MYFSYFRHIYNIGYANSRFFCYGVLHIPIQLISGDNKHGRQQPINVSCCYCFVMRISPKQLLAQLLEEKLIS